MSAKPRKNNPATVSAITKFEKLISKVRNGKRDHSSIVLMRVCSTDSIPHKSIHKIKSRMNFTASNKFPATY